MNTSASYIVVNDYTIQNAIKNAKIQRKAIGLNEGDD